MPQFEFHTFVPQLIWLAISFTILYVMLAQVVLPGIERSLSERALKIKADLDEAEAARLASEKALKSYEHALGEARAEAAKIALATKAAIKAESDAKRAEIDGELSAKLEAAEARIRDQRDQALKSVRAVALEVTSAIIEKVLRERPAEDAVARAVDGELNRAA